MKKTFSCYLVLLGLILLQRVDAQVRAGGSVRKPNRRAKTARRGSLGTQHPARDRGRFDHGG